MIKILAISGSPVEGASTDFMVMRLAAEVKRSLGSDLAVHTNFVKLNDLEFAPCQACGEAPTPEFCIFEDDLTPIYEALAGCDCLIFGSPVYFDSVTAQAKAFIDRCNCVRPPDFKNTDAEHDFIKILDRKRPGAMVLVGGERGWFEGARRVIAGFFKWVEVTNDGKVVYRSTDINRSGTAADDPSLRDEIVSLGRHLAELIKESLK